MEIAVKIISYTFLIVGISMIAISCGLMTSIGITLFVASYQILVYLNMNTKTEIVEYTMKLTDDDLEKIVKDVIEGLK